MERVQERGRAGGAPSIRRAANRGVSSAVSKICGEQERPDPSEELRTIRQVGDGERRSGNRRREREGGQPRQVARSTVGKTAARPSRRRLRRAGAPREYVATCQVRVAAAVDRPGPARSGGRCTVSGHGVTFTDSLIGSVGSDRGGRIGGAESTPDEDPALSFHLSAHRCHGIHTRPSHCKQASRGPPRPNE
jgi:hypothetical protein